MGKAISKSFCNTTSMTKVQCSNYAVGGQQQAGSDIDVCVLGKVSLLEVVKALSPVQETLRREMNPVTGVEPRFCWNVGSTHVPRKRGLTPRGSKEKVSDPFLLIHLLICECSVDIFKYIKYI